MSGQGNEQTERQDAPDAEGLDDALVHWPAAQVPQVRLTNCGALIDPVAARQ